MIYRYLDCGDPHNGFARMKCNDCGHEYLLAFSCKRCHFYPSCHQKRVVEFGEWLCVDVLKKIPPTGISYSAFRRSYAVIAIQTFGDFLGFNPHCHILVTDGCFYGDKGMFPDR